MFFFSQCLVTYASRLDRKMLYCLFIIFCTLVGHSCGRPCPDTIHGNLHCDFLLGESHDLGMFACEVEWDSVESSAERL